MKNFYLKATMMHKLIAGAGFIGMQLCCMNTHATVYNVTNAADGHATNQLRGALEAANASAGPHTINLAANTYVLSLGQLYIGNVSNQHITISGAGSSTTTIDGNNLSRILNIDSAGNHSGIDFSVTGVKFMNGKAMADSYGGAAILGYGSSFVINITDCDFNNNTLATTGSSGGALNLGAGTITITGCNFTNNTTASATGGAIYYFLGNTNTGSLTITDCSFSGNSANGANAHGGALDINVQGNNTNPVYTFNADIRKNSFVNNHANGTGGYGGAIYIIDESAYGLANIKFNRFNGNTAAATGSSALYLNNNATIFGAMDLTQNWYGCNGGPAGCSDKASVANIGNGNYTFSPYLQLKTTTSPATICIGATTTVTTGFTSNSANATIAAADLDALIGQPVYYYGTQGTVSGGQSSIQANGMATATFTSNASGTATVNTQVDNVPITDLTARANVTVTTSSVPVITIPPTSLNVCYGNTASYHVVATGALSYQWYRGTTPLVNGTNASGSVVTGATTADMSIANCGAADNGTNYQVKITNACGTTTSGFFTLIMNIAPTPGTPASVTACAGGSAIFTISVTGSPPFTYQWRKGTTPLSDGVTANGSTITGSANDTLIISNITAADAGGYNVVVNNNCVSAFTNSGTLTVNAPGTWLGTNSTNWSDVANWSCNTLPSITTNVMIPAGTAFGPSIDVTNAAANNITINSGASLTFTGSSNVLNVSGNITNTGTFNPSNGKVIFSGTAQNIPAATYKNVQILGGGNKILLNNVSITGTLTMTTGFLLLGASNLIITNSGNISGANFTSFIVENGTGRLTQQNIGTGGRTGTIGFPIGISTTSYTPLIINNAGIADDFTAGVIIDVYPGYDANNNGTGTAITSNAVGKTWLIKEATPGGSNVTLSLTWDTADELAGFNRSACFVSHYMNGGWLQGSSGMASGAVPYYTQTLTNVTSFSPFGIGSANSPLPLHLVSFTGKNSGDINVLTWVIADDDQLDHFELERSGDGQYFRKIATIKDAGNNTASYNYNDNIPDAQSYYRLKTVTTDQDYFYSTIIKINKENNTGYLIEAGPNPFDQQIKLSVAVPKSTTVVIKMTDINGRVLQSWTKLLSAGANTINIDQLRDLPEGHYYINVITDQQNKTFKMIRRRL